MASLIVASCLSTIGGLVDTIRATLTSIPELLALLRRVVVVQGNIHEDVVYMRQMMDVVYIREMMDELHELWSQAHAQPLPRLVRSSIPAFPFPPPPPTGPPPP